MNLLLIALGMLGILRLGELYLSQRNWQHHRASAKIPTERLFPWMVLLHTSLFPMLVLEGWAMGVAFAGPLSIAAGLIFACALILRVWTLKTLGQSWNVRIVVGPSYPIIDNGPYRWIRHPNYLVVILELASFPLIWGLWRSALVLTLLNAWVLRYRIRSEEAHLARNPQWLMRMANKPRFLPRIH